MPLHQLAEEQAALRRVATLVAGASSPEEVMAAVAEEVGRLLDADLSTVNRYEENGDRVVLASWTSLEENVVPTGTRGTMAGRNVATMVFETRQPARTSHHGPDLGPTALAVLAARMRCSIGVPIVVDGRLWGAMCVGSMRYEFPRDAEVRLADFTELVETAIANAEARMELRFYADEQVALRRVATRVADGAGADEVFAVVCAEIGQLLDADVTTLNRYDDAGYLVIVGTWGGAGTVVPKDMRFEIGPKTVSAAVWDTGRPARLDGYDADANSSTPELTRGVRSAVGAPIVVDGRKWGVIGVSSTRRSLPPGTEATTRRLHRPRRNGDRERRVASRAQRVARPHRQHRGRDAPAHRAQPPRRRAATARVARAQRPLCTHPRAGRRERPRRTTRGISRAGWTRSSPKCAGSRKGSTRPFSARADSVPRSRLSSSVLQFLPRSTCGLTGCRSRSRSPPYYAISEALTNAAKHAEASHVHVTVERDDERGVVRVSVSDDGRGGASLDAGTGLIGVKDRVEALGGRMRLSSQPGEGTTYDIALPIE